MHIIHPIQLIQLFTRWKKKDGNENYVAFLQFSISATFMEDRQIMKDEDTVFTVTIMEKALN